MNLSLSVVMFSQGGKTDEKATKVGSESDVLDFIEQRVNLSLAELATRTGDDATSTGDGFKVCVCVQDGASPVTVIARILESS